MPEYSSTTITPADGVKTPAMNGSTSGNYTLSALRDFILASKGSANGLASLDSNGKLPSAQLPDLADDVLVYASYASFPASGTAGKLYIAGDTNKIYRWDDSLGTPAYVYLKVDWTDLTDGSVTVKKAECDASGNTITSTYETKADANNLKDAINANSNRIANLEQKAGDYSIVQYRGTNAVPTGKAKYGLVKSIVGKSRAWNQLFKAGLSVLTRMTMDSNGVVSYTNGNADIWAENFSENFVDSYGTLENQDHVYFVCYQYISGTIGSVPANFSNGNDGSTIFTFDSSFHAVLLTGGSLYPYIKSSGQTDYTDLKFKFVIRDITPIFNEYTKAELVALGANGVIALLSDITKYDTLNTGSLVDTEVSGVKSVGVNIWDGAREVGDIDASAGTDFPSSTRWRSIGYTQILPSTEYYIQFNGGIVKARARFYDISKNYIGYTDLGGSEVSTNSPFTTPTNAYYMRIAPNISNIPLDSPIQICLNSYADKTTYHPYKTDTLSLPETVTLKGVGTCVETLDVETGVLDDGKFGLLDLGELDYIKEESVATGQFYAFVNITEQPKYHGALLCPKYLWQSGNAEYYNMMDGYVAMTNGQSPVVLRVRDSRYSVMSASDFKIAMSGVPLLYQKYTYTPSLPIDPVPDNTLYTEGGGTIDTIQDQTPVIDNCLDVGYLAV